jgi:hypothetical protein
VFVYAYPRNRPAGVAIGTALIHPAGAKRSQENAAS